MHGAPVGHNAAMTRSERDKMLAGEQYNCHDPQLQQLAIDARRRVARFCAADPADTAGRSDLLAAIFGRVERERGVHIEPPFYADYGVHTSIGEDTFINVNCVIIDDAPIAIGRRVLLGPAVQLITAMHPLRVAERRTPHADVAAGSAAWRTMTAPVTIGDDVWLGAGVIVLPGVTIGERSTVAAGAVVTRDVPPDCLAAGTPAQVIRSLA